MNERIEKLAEQCGFRSNPDIYDRDQSFDIERFAELIVRECVLISRTSADGFSAGRRMAERFGVAE